MQYFFTTSPPACAKSTFTSTLWFEFIPIFSVLNLVQWSHKRPTALALDLLASYFAFLLPEAVCCMFALWLLLSPLIGLVKSLVPPPTNSSPQSTGLPQSTGSLLVDWSPQSSCLWVQNQLFALFTVSSSCNANLSLWRWSWRWSWRWRWLRWVWRWWMRRIEVR